MSEIIFKSLDPMPDESEPDHDPIFAQWKREWDPVYSILTHYLQPTSTQSQTEVIDEVIQFWHEPTPGKTIAVMVVPINLARQIPHDHPSQKKLADFVLALHDSGKWIPEQDMVTREEKQRFFWERFTLYMMGGIWQPEQHLDEEEDPIGYANFCAFVANVIFPEYRSSRFFEGMGFEALMAAAQIDSSNVQEVRDAYAIGAAQYIIFQAPTIFHEVMIERQWAASQPQKKKNWISNLVFFWADWQNWKRAFRAIAVDTAHGEKCREIAQRAADLMALQEKIDVDDQPAKPQA